MVVTEQLVLSKVEVRLRPACTILQAPARKAFCLNQDFQNLRISRIMTAPDAQF